MKAFGEKFARLGYSLSWLRLHSVLTNLDVHLSKLTEFFVRHSGGLQISLHCLIASHCGGGGR